MQEIIYRRFRRSLDEIEKINNNELDIAKSKFSIIPDIILIDGGLGHINAVREVLDDLKIRIPIFGMVKDNKHRTRDLISFDGDKQIYKNMDLFRFITQIQDEVHRFTIEYNKKLRTNRYKSSKIDNIPGIGPSKKKALIKHFGSVSEIKKANIDDIEKVKGINRELAMRIIEFFK